jgi:1,4-alpha-glucan branching enzyme
MDPLARTVPGDSKPFVSEGSPPVTSLMHDPDRDRDLAFAAVIEGRSGRAFDWLGIHPLDDPSSPGRVVRAFLPWAREAWVLRNGGARAGAAEATPMVRVHPEGIFQTTFPEEDAFFPYRLRTVNDEGSTADFEDPYRFGPMLDEERVRGFLDGGERRAHEVLGARCTESGGVPGTLFAVWAPHARAVNVAGDWNGWDPRCHPMRSRGATGVWELFLPNVGPGALYKYQIVTEAGRALEKADPFGRAVELRPATASEVWDPDSYKWGDAAWLEKRAHLDRDREPMSVYEVHLGSWRRRSDRAPGDPGWLSYRELADELLPYVKEMQFTHVELLPILEHPLDQSWGYQPLGFFAPTSRHGSPDDFRCFVDRAHQLGIGVILDWVPGHFPRDEHGLVRFDGTPLFENPDPGQAEHPDWGTLVFDFSRPEVRSFLVSSALHWLEDYHLDGLRVDAVASMLYLDYSRPEGTWTPNQWGGNEDFHAADFLRGLNDAVHEEVPGAVMIAEESTVWPGVSQGTDRGGLGFDQKWNMGWMNDTLEVMSKDPLFRRYHYDQLRFSAMYAFSERFTLPLSHDEVVHGKHSLLSKMPGVNRERFANLRLLLAYMWTHPGKKLLFMGGEFGQWTEWDSDGELDWVLLNLGPHQGLSLMVRDLNRIYRTDESLHALDFRPEGFEWLDCHDPERTILSFLRWGPDWRDFAVVVANFTPVDRNDFRLAVPFPGRYEVVFNSEAPVYGGEGSPVPTQVETRPGEFLGRDQFLELPLPGLAALILKRAGD